MCYEFPQFIFISKILMNVKSIMEYRNVIPFCIKFSECPINAKCIERFKLNNAIMQIECPRIGNHLRPFSTASNKIGLLCRNMVY